MMGRKQEVVGVLVLACALLVAAVGANPRYLEELRVGGGYGSSPDGGVDIEKNGDIRSDGSLTLGKDGSVDHRISIITGTDNDAFVDLNEADSTHGGALWFDGSEGTLGLGTRNGSATVTNALTISRGEDDVSISDNLTVSGNIELTGIVNCRAATGVSELVLSPVADDGTSTERIKLFRYSSGGGSAILNVNYPGTTDTTCWIDAKTGDIHTDGDFEAEGGDLAAGNDGSTRGVLTSWDGSGGNAPGCVRLASPDGTLWYLFVEDDGTVKVHNSLPTSNGDGSVVGGQT